MSKTLQGSGEYTDNASGKVYTFKYEYEHCDLQDLIAVLEEGGESAEEALAVYNRMGKVDARNRASQKAQASAGHNQRVLTPEQKEANKSKAKAQRAVFSALQGKSAEELESLGIPAEVIEALTA